MQSAGRLPPGAVRPLHGLTLHTVTCASPLIVMYEKSGNPVERLPTAAVSALACKARNVVACVLYHS